MADQALQLLATDSRTARSPSCFLRGSYFLSLSEYQALSESLAVCLAVC